MPEWFAYIIKSDKNQFYTGVSTDVERRFAEHLAVFTKQKSAKGAKFFRTQKPVAVVYRKQCLNRSHACQLEWQIKQLSRQGKECFIKANQ